MKTKRVMDQAKFLEENHNIISDHSLIDNLRYLINLVSYTGCDKEKGDYLARYRKSDMSGGLLMGWDMMMGQFFYF